MDRRLLTDPQDLAYARSQFRRVDAVDPSLPRPAYQDEAGGAYVPHDYEAQETDRDRFFERLAAEADRCGLSLESVSLDDEWNAYWDGGYSLCLKSASPENIARKIWLMERITASIAPPVTTDAAWVVSLENLVNELDALERPFCDFDRAYFGGPVSRDRLITAVRERYIATAKDRPIAPHVPRGLGLANRPDRERIQDC